MALASRSPAVRTPAALRSSALPARPLRMVLTRADPPSGGARVTREFREGDSEVTVPGAPTARKEADGLYVDTSAPPPRPRTDNMSKEMKARLRKEYTGLGGAENTQPYGGDTAATAAALPPPAPRMWPRTPLVVAAAAVETDLLEGPTSSSTASSSSLAAGDNFTVRPPGATAFDALTSTSSSSSSTASPSSSPFPPSPSPPPSSPPSSGSKGHVASWALLEEGEAAFRSTPEMRAWTWGCIAMLGATLEQATRQIQGPEDAAVFGGAVLLAFILADLGTGVYHWAVDNYGDASTPVFGRQIAAFQGHHQRPWTITQREFANNVHQVFGPACYPAAALLTLSPLMPLGWNAWSSAFLFTVCMSQQFHAWSHMKKSELHPAVVALQDAGVLIGRRMHGAHHRAPFEANYSIVSGWTNPLLDSLGFFRRLEKAIFNVTGVEPRCWHELQEEWRELERPQ